jgi:hypothetical protein
MHPKLMTSIKLQKTLHHKMQQHIINDHYGMRGKSQWLIEAIETFLQLPDYPTLVYIADEMDQLTEVLSIRLPEDLIAKIELAVIEVRREYPTLEGVKSNLIRASILQRLIRSSTSVTEV